MYGPRVLAGKGWRRKSSIVPRSGRCRPVACTIGSFDAALSGRTCRKTTAICVVDEQGRRLWRGACVADPGAISGRVLRHAGVVDAKVGVETGSMTPWLVHGLRSAGLYVECLDARRVKAALQMRLNKTDENDAEG